MRARWTWALVLGAAVLLGWWCSPCEQAAPPPDARLAAHTRELCAIAEQHVATPRRGVELVFAYLGKHTPEMAQASGELFVLIERIPDDAAHDARAREAARRLREPMGRCAPVFERFLDAVQRDPEARALMERGTQRLGRTLEIIFGPEGAGALMPLRLPSAGR